MRTRWAPTRPISPASWHSGADAPGLRSPWPDRSIAIYEHVPPSPYPASSPVISPPTMADLPNRQGPCLRNSSGHPALAGHDYALRPFVPRQEDAASPPGERAHSIAATGSSRTADQGSVILPSDGGQAAQRDPNSAATS